MSGGARRSHLYVHPSSERYKFRTVVTISKLVSKNDSKCAFLDSEYYTLFRSMQKSHLSLVALGHMQFEPNAVLVLYAK